MEWHVTMYLNRIGLNSKKSIEIPFQFFFQKQWFCWVFKMFDSQEIMFLTIAWSELFMITKHETRRNSWYLIISKYKIVFVMNDTQYLKIPTSKTLPSVSFSDVLCEHNHFQNTKLSWLLLILYKPM